MISWIKKDVDEDTGSITISWKDHETFYHSFDEREADWVESILHAIWNDGFALGKESAKLTGNEQPF